MWPLQTGGQSALHLREKGLPVCPSASCQIGWADDEGADGLLAIVQSGREERGRVVFAGRMVRNTVRMDGWMDEEEEIARCRSCTTSSIPPWFLILVLTLICLSCCFIGRQQQLLPDQRGRLLGRPIVSLTRGQ